MIPACRKVLLPASIGVLLLSLSVAPGCCKRCVGAGGQKTAQADNAAKTGTVGVTVTEEVPHSKETISDIRDREVTNPLPAREDRAIHSHKIPRPVNDNDVRMK